MISWDVYVHVRDSRSTGEFDVFSPSRCCVHGDFDDDVVVVVGTIVSSWLKSHAFGVLCCVPRTSLAKAQFDVSL